MKKSLSVILSLLILFSVTACGGDNKKNSDGENLSSQQEKDGRSTKDKDKSGKKGKVSKAEILRNLHVRRAIALGIDKEALAKTVSNSAEPVNFLIPRGFSFDENGGDFRNRYPNGFLAYNPEEARKEWKKAKKELGFDKLELEILTFNGEEAGKMIDKLGEDLAKNLDGLKIVANQQTFKQKKELNNRGNFYIDMAGWTPDYTDPLAFLDLFTKNSSNNAGKYNNKKFEDLVKKAKEDSNFKERFELLQKAEKLLLDDVALIPLYQDSEMYLIRPYIQNLYRDAYNTGFVYKYVSTDKIVDGKRTIQVLGGPDGIVFDVNKVVDQASINILNNLSEGLISYDKDGNKAPGIAQSWDISEDKMTYTFHLRKSSWSNGEALTAKDFVDSWHRLADSNIKSEYTTMLETGGVKNAIKVINGELPPEELGVKALDDYTLQVSLDRPVPYFLDLMAFPCFHPINKNFIDQHGDDYATSMDSLIYNGPYKISSWDMGFGLDLSKNEYYWDFDNVANDGVKYRMAKDIDTALAMYDNHDIDLCPLDSENTEQRKNSPEFVSYKDFSVFYLVINMDSNEK